MASRPVIDGPDLICIGMPKAGTGWLYDQLRHHPDFWMPPVKELHYLDRLRPRIKTASKRLEKMEQLKNASRRKKRSMEDWGAGRRMTGDQRDIDFLNAVVEMSGEKRDIERYCSLFRFKGELLSGDITPGYTQLEHDLIQTVAARLPDTKVVMLVRDPVARQWSHLCMLHRSEHKGGFDPALTNDPDAFRTYLHQSIMHERLLSSRIYQHWKRAAPKIDIRFFMFDDIAGEPAKVLREVLTLAGADPEKQSTIEPGFNVKARGQKIELNETAKAVLVDYLKDEIKACATIFGGHAQGWAAQYGL